MARKSANREQVRNKRFTLLLNAQEYAALVALANQQTEGNISMLVRKLLQQAASLLKQ